MTTRPHTWGSPIVQCDENAASNSWPDITDDKSDTREGDQAEVPLQLLGMSRRVHQVVRSSDDPVASARGHLQRLLIFAVHRHGEVLVTTDTLKVYANDAQK